MTLPTDHQLALHRIWQHVGGGPPDACWLWPGAVTSSGYGAIRIAGKTEVVHRLVYEDLHGPLPAGARLTQLCRNRRCVNPAHLCLADDPRVDATTFWAQIAKDEEGGCWRWQGLHQNGWPAVKWHGHMRQVGRVAYALIHRRDLDSLPILDHICPHHWCVNPAHLVSSTDRSVEAERRRLLRHVEKQPNGCWQWTGSFDDRGFPLLGVGYKRCFAHRLAYGWWVGELRPRQRIRQTCGNRRCVNPAHLTLAQPR